MQGEYFANFHSIARASQQPKTKKLRHIYCLNILLEKICFIPFIQQIGGRKMGFRIKTKFMTITLAVTFASYVSAFASEVNFNITHPYSFTTNTTASYQESDMVVSVTTLGVTPDYAASVGWDPLYSTSGASGSTGGQLYFHGANASAKFTLGNGNTFSLNNLLYSSNIITEAYISTSNFTTNAIKLSDLTTSSDIVSTGSYFYATINFDNDLYTNISWFTITTPNGYATQLDNINYTVQSPVPVPSTMLFLGSALVSFAGLGRRQRKA